MKFSGYIYSLINFFFLMYPVINSYSQKIEDRNAVCDFTFNDTVCINTPVNITNLSTGASTYNWKFCAGTPLSFPNGINSGTLAQLNVPLGITLVREGNTFYSFVTNAGDSTIVRTTFQNSLLSTPVYDVLNIQGILTGKIFGIQIKSDNGNWYGFVTNGSSLVRLDFGSSLANLSPAASIIASSALMNKAQGLAVDYDGQNWVGFCTNFPSKTITRFSWGPTLASIPVVSDLGNIGGLVIPMQPALINDGSGWYLFIANTTSLVRLQLGNSLLNVPTEASPGNLPWISDTRGISMLLQCKTPYALLANHNVIENQLFQVNFTGGSGGLTTVTPLGSPGGLYETVALSESLMIGDTIFCIALNSRPSLSILVFPDCTNPALPESTKFDPSPVVFSGEGVYTISLTVNPGLPTEQKLCKVIHVTSAKVDPGPDTTLCEGTPFTLNGGDGYQSYLWNTGGTTQHISVTTTGTYSVQVTDRFGCQAMDSINVRFTPKIHVTVDTSVCFGNSYFAAGKLQTSSGVYIDTLTVPDVCEYIKTTHLFVKPPIILDIGNDTCMKADTSFNLVVNVAGASSYTWQDGLQDSIFKVTSPGIYWVRVVVDNCSKYDTIRIKSCSMNIYFYIPAAFSPNGDGLNDIFRPAGNNIYTFTMTVYDRWGQLIFDSGDSGKGWDGTCNGTYCPPGVYAYMLSYRPKSVGTDLIKTKGVVTLVR